MKTLSPTSQPCSPETGRRLHIQGSLMRVKATGHDTQGAYTLIDILLLPGFRFPLHVHTEEDEGLYVLEGEIEARVEDQTVRAQSGAFLALPCRVPHGFRVVGERPCRVLMLL